MMLQAGILIVGFLFLVKGADWFVEGSASIARKFGIPQLIIGLTIVAMGTSMPEAAVSITAAMQQNAGITIGNVVGSNILNIFIILGLTALITNVAIQRSTLFYEIPFMMFVTVNDMRNHRRKSNACRGHSLMGTVSCISWLFVCNVKKRGKSGRRGSEKLSCLEMSSFDGGRRRPGCKRK